MITKVSTLRTNYSQSFQGRDNGSKEILRASYSPSFQGCESSSKKALGPIAALRRALYLGLAVAGISGTAIGCTNPVMDPDPIEATVTTPTKPPTTELTTLQKKMIDFAEALNPIKANQSRSNTLRSSASAPTSKFESLGFKAYGDQNTFIVKTELADKIELTHEIAPVGYPNLADTETVIATETTNGIKFTYPNGGTVEYIKLPDGTTKKIATSQGFGEVISTLVPDSVAGRVLEYDSKGTLVGPITDITATFSNVVAKIKATLSDAFAKIEIDNSLEKSAKKLFRRV